MRPTVSELKARNERLAAQVRDERDAKHACASQLERVAAELSHLKDEIALHIVACKHPSSALSDAHSAAIALQEALQAHGIDLRIELARLEGADL